MVSEYRKSIYDVGRMTLTLCAKPLVNLYFKRELRLGTIRNLEPSMTDRPRERWEILAEQVAKEQNTEKIIELTKELNKALAERDAKNEGQKSSAA